MAGDVIDIWSGKPKSEEELRQEEENAPLQDEACGRLEKYLGSLSLETALETGEQEPYVERLADLETMDLKGHRSLTSGAVDKIVFERIVEDLEQRGQSLDEQQRRALNNLVQIERVGEIVDPLPSIMIPDPAWSRRLDQLQDRVRERKTELLRPAAGAEANETLDAVRQALEAGWQSESWDAELAERLKAIKASPENTPGNFLERCAFIGAIRFDDNDAVDLRHHRQLKEAIEAFKKGDPAAVAGHRNPYLEGAADAARRGGDEMAEKRTAEKVRFLSEKIAQELARRRMKNAGT